MTGGVLAATVDTVIQQIGGVIVALIAAGGTMFGILYSQNRQRGPKLYEMSHDEALEALIGLTKDNERLRAERNAWRTIAQAHGLDRRTDSED